MHGNVRDIRRKSSTCSGLLCSIAEVVSVSEEEKSVRGRPMLGRWQYFEIVQSMDMSENCPNNKNVCFKHQAMGDTNVQ